MYCHQVRGTHSGLHHPTNQIVTDTARGIVGTFTILNPTVTEVNAALAGILVGDTWTGGGPGLSTTQLSITKSMSTTHPTAPARPCPSRGLLV